MGLVAQRLLRFAALQAAWRVLSGQIHYSVPEESQPGTFVGRLAQDLGLEAEELVPRMFRMVSREHRGRFEVDAQSGALLVNSRLDREALCGRSAPCALRLEAIAERPLRVFQLEVELKDINDNAPRFPQREQKLPIPESRLPGSRFLLSGAADADTGTNARLSYSLSQSDFFALEGGSEEGQGEAPVLLLKAPLDREEAAAHRLLLTATDGGKPRLTGTVQLAVEVLDANDNPPVFDQSVYKVKLWENAPLGTLVAKVNATDLDEGINKEISYSFSNNVPQHFTKIFSISSKTGEVKVIGEVDFEDSPAYDLQVVAEDKGHPPLSGDCKVLIEVIDVNDNAPEVSVSSLAVPVPEDSPPGTVVALVSVSDRDSGANGQVSCSLWPPGLPFKLVSTFKNYYSLTLAESLDQEQVANYTLTVSAQDQGEPPLSASSSFLVPVSDVNDNTPTFAQPSYTVFVKENNPPGAHIFTVSASDPDLAESSLISYWIEEKESLLSSYISVHSESGKLYALQPLDYEELKLLEFQVRAKDAGLPPLTGSVMVQVFLVDENDNVPVVSQSLEETPILLVAPVVSGQTVGKIRALDADSGYNAWLHYELHESTTGPWRVGQYSGEISASRALNEVDERSIQALVVVVKDHGKPSLSATATLTVSLVANAQAVRTEGLPRTGERSKPLGDSVNVYLITAICSVSSLFLLAILAYVVLRCYSQAKEAVVYGPGTATLVCASEVGSWSYSNRHSHILAGVSGEAGAKNDLMVFSPNIPVFAENREVRNGKELLPNTSGMVSHEQPTSLTSSSTASQ